METEIDKKLSPLAKKLVASLEARDGWELFAAAASTYAVQKGNVAIFGEWDTDKFHVAVTNTRNHIRLTFKNNVLFALDRED